MGIELNASGCRGDRGKYIIRRNETGGNIWSYQIYRSRLDEFGAKGPFVVLAIGDLHSQSQRVFALPNEYLEKNVFAHVQMDDRRRYTFEINKQTLEFTWRNGVHMDGRPFLVE